MGTAHSTPRNGHSVRRSTLSSNLPFAQIVTMIAARASRIITAKYAMSRFCDRPRTRMASAAMPSRSAAQNTSEITNMIVFPRLYSSESVVLSLIISYFTAVRRMLLASAQISAASRGDNAKSLIVFKMRVALFATERALLAGMSY